MAGSYPQIPENARRPSNSVPYPIRIGKSLRKSRNNTSSRSPRDIMTIRFNHVPESINLHQPGTLQANGEKCTIQLPMADGTSKHFNGSRKIQKTQSSVDDYVLIFDGESFWLEKVSDMLLGMKLVEMGKQRAPIEYPTVTEHDDPDADPDSWMPHSAESGSPITPEEDVVDDIPQQPIIPSSRVGGKSTPSGPNAPNRKIIMSGRGTSASARNVTNHQPVATKSVATKGLANKGLARVPTESMDEDDEESNKDSSSSDDSDDSGSDSGDDSGDYTEESSDEE